MWPESAQLLDVNDDFGQLYRPKANDLPQIVPRFFVPPLEDKPQNPILEALKLENINSNLLPRLFQLPEELAALSLNVSQIVEPEPKAKVEEIWKNALIRRRGTVVRFISKCLSGILFHGYGYYCRMAYFHGIDYGPRTQAKQRPPHSYQSKTI